MQAKLSQYIRVDTNSHSDSEGSTSGIGIGTATDNAYHILPASDSPVSSCPFSSSTTTSLVYGNGKYTSLILIKYNQLSSVFKFELSNKKPLVVLGLSIFRIILN